MAFDPLDGSSIIGANWSVGSIFGIWAGDSPIGQRVKDIIGAVYAVYGPRTLMVMARPSRGEMIINPCCNIFFHRPPHHHCLVCLHHLHHQDVSKAHNNTTMPPTQQQEGLIVQEFTLSGTGTWLCTCPRVQLAPRKAVFAPANLRAAADNAPYRALVDTWLQEKYTLRYSGGLCPDVHHMLAKVCAGLQHHRSV